jgi:hypothetical protein
MPIGPAQAEALRVYRVTKPANVNKWLTFHFTHPDWSEDINLVAVTGGDGVEFDESIYNFEGIQYKPVSMSVTLPNESKDDNGKMTLSFARAGSVVKKRMSEITPANARVPKTFLYRLYLEGETLPSEMFDGFVSVDYPKISGQDVSIQADIYNPSLLTNRFISTLDTYPELRNS